ncbi:MAG: hypothetical protein ACRCX2_22365 [Paraclostridium sp.]
MIPDLLYTIIMLLYIIGFCGFGYMLYLIIKERIDRCPPAPTEYRPDPKENNIVLDSFKLILAIICLCLVVTWIFLPFIIMENTESNNRINRWS